MPHEVSLRTLPCSFTCYGVHEAKELGLIDSWEKEGTYAPVSTVFEHGEGRLLADWIEHMPDAILIATGRYQITVYRPKSKLSLMTEEEMDEQERKNAEEFYVHHGQTIIPDTVGVGGRDAIYKEGIEGNKISAEELHEINVACTATLAEQGIAWRKWNDGNNFLFNGKDEVTKGQFRNLKEWAIKLHNETPEAFSVQTLQDSLDIDEGLAKRLYHAAKAQIEFDQGTQETKTEKLKEG